ncbi:BppU family phage baseplate upper protein [Enterococcus faecium]|uniref:BppU family phage baseplate upper protein n=1 Tax=Enterococcus faecium TaxID=1352 RepID=UPI001CD49042|nr:BppU family phage baseplate upper protein [Enterococcus faecium]
MADRKVGEITVPTEPVSRATKITGFTFKSYDKNAGVLQFNIENQDGSPTDLIDATVRLFMHIYQGEEKKEFPIFDNQIITESYMQGIVKYRIPDMLLSYEGKVDANVYIDFPDGSHTDNLAFTFNIEKSIIDGDVQLNGEYYFKDFQQLLDGVKQEATDAVNAALTNVDSTIEKANQQINEFVEGATQAIDQTVDEVTEQLQDTQTKVEAVSKNVSSAQNDLTILEDRIDQTNQNLNEMINGMKLYEAWAWSKDGTDRFTTVYPGENYVLKSKDGYTAAGNGGSNQYPAAINSIPLNPDILGKDATIQYKLTISNYESGSFVALKLYNAVGVWDTFGGNSMISGNGTWLIQWKGTLPPLKENGLSKVDFNTNLKADILIEELQIKEGTEYQIYTPAPSEDYANAYPTYKGISIVDSNNPNDYSWDVTPEYTEKGLNDTVSLTEPQSVEGLKNFEDGLQIAGKEVATVPEDTGWVNLTAINGHSWNKQGQIRRIGKLVMFRGSLKGSTLSTQDFCTIPEGFRPSNPTDNYEYQFLLPPQSSNTLDNGGMAYIRPNGVCGLPSFRGTVNLFLAPIQYYID